MDVVNLFKRHKKSMFVFKTVLNFFSMATIVLGCHQIQSLQTSDSSLDVVKGSEAQLNDPVRQHTVRILSEVLAEKQGERAYSSCTGTLIGSYHVLTAAHCVFNALNVTVLFEPNGWAESDLPVRRRAIGYEAHPEYDHVKITNDIAVVELSQAAPAHYSVARIGSAKKLNSAQPVIMAGYGLSKFDEESAFEPILRRAETSINRVVSSFRLSPFDRPNTILTYSSLIFSSPQICSGDSGGPLFLDELPGIRLVGVASFGDKKCTTVSAYTNIFPYWDWVKDIMRRNPNALLSATALPKVSRITRQTSDEYSNMSPAVCQGGTYAVGFQCQGRYCDNVGLTCAGATSQQIDLGLWSPFYSEEGSNSYQCYAGEAVTGIRCRGAYCDDISIRCTRIQNLAARECHWSDSVSEEGKGRLELDLGSYIAGFQCEGRYCDNKKAYVCRSDEKWTPFTSDEQKDESLAVCGDGEIARGFACTGRYCDNIALKCAYETSTVIDDPGANWSNYFSEEDEGTHICKDQGFISGIRCDNSYCDRVSVRCTEIDGVIHQGCFWTDYFSEENGGRMDIPDGFGAAGMRCDGRYCDKKQIYVCPTNPPI